MQILLVVCFRKCSVTHQCMIAAGVGAAAVVRQCRLHVHQASKTFSKSRTDPQANAPLWKKKNNNKKTNKKNPSDFCLDALCLCFDVTLLLSNGCQRKDSALKFLYHVRKKGTKKNKSNRFDCERASARQHRRTEEETLLFSVRKTNCFNT